jgi:hypothetical protein
MDFAVPDSVKRTLLEFQTREQGFREFDLFHRSYSSSGAALAPVMALGGHDDVVDTSAQQEYAELPTPCA